MPLHGHRHILPSLAALFSVHCHSVLWSWGEGSHESSTGSSSGTTRSETSTSEDSEASNVATTAANTSTSSGETAGDSSVIPTGAGTDTGTSTMVFETVGDASSTEAQTTTLGVDSESTLTTGTESGGGNLCGNGIVDLEHMEECEPPATATCDAYCKLLCGNNVTDDGEECDEGPNNGGLPHFCNHLCERNGLFVFVSDELYTGNLGGPLELGFKCDTLAQKAGSRVSNNHFLPWISVAGVGPESWAGCADPDKRRPYYLVDRLTLVANGSPPFKPLEHSIDMDQFGVTVTQSGVWTNTYTNGSSVSIDKYCQGWTSGSDGFLAVFGLTSKVDERWTRVATPGHCDETRRIYCFEQPPVLELCAKP